MTTKKDIESALMRGADTLRDTIDAANYKDYVLPVMFVKYLSDSYTDAVEELSKQYSGIRLERQKKYLPFMVAEGCSFYDLYQQRFADNIGQLMNAAMRQIEEKDYTAVLRRYRVKEIWTYGIAFWDKECRVVAKCIAQ